MPRGLARAYRAGMLRPAILNPLVVVVVTAAGCSPSGETGTRAEPPQASSSLGCTVDADCSDANVCTADTCAAGRCQYAYLPSTAYAVLSGSPAGALLRLPIPTRSLSVSGFTLTACPAGADPLASPPVCVLEVDLTSAALAFAPQPDGTFLISGTVPVRAQRIPVRARSFFGSTSGDVTLTGNGACPGSVQTFAAPSATVAFSISPVDGTLAASATVDSAAVGGALAVCGNSVLASLVGQASAQVAPTLAAEASARIAPVVAPQLCLSAPCPTGTVDDAGTCRLTIGGPCVARGLDPATGMLAVPACAQ